MLRHTEEDLARQRGPQQLRVRHGDLLAGQNGLRGHDHNGLAIGKVMRRIRGAAMVEQAGEGEEGAGDHLVTLRHAIATLEGVRVEGANRATEVLQHIRLLGEVLEALGRPLHLPPVVLIRVGLQRVEQTALPLAEEEAAHHTEYAQGAWIDVRRILRPPLAEQLALERVAWRLHTLRADGQAAASAAQG